MAKTIKIASGNQVISIESDNTGVPDVTEGTGPDMIKLQDDAMAAPNAENAEFNSAEPDSPVESQDKPQEVEKANESAKVMTFMDLRAKHVAEQLALEGFTLSAKKMEKAYPSVKAFLSSPEAKAAAEEAKKYAEKKGLKFLSSSEISSKKVKQTLLNKLSQGNTDKRLSPDIETITVDGVPYLVMHFLVAKQVKGNEVIAVFVAFGKVNESGEGKYFVKAFASRVNIRKDVSAEAFDFNFSVEDDEEEKKEAEGSSKDDGEATDDPVTPDEADNSPSEEPPAAEETPAEEPPAPAEDPAPAPETPAEDPAPDTPAEEPEVPVSDGTEEGAGDVTESDGVTTVDAGDVVITITNNKDDAVVPEEQPAAEETPAEECGGAAPAPVANTEGCGAKAKEGDPAAPAPNTTAEEAPVEQQPQEAPTEGCDSKAADANASIESFFAELGL